MLTVPSMLSPDLQIIDRHAAHAQGKVHFFTGRPCRRGHVSPRFVSSGNCISCATFRKVPSVTNPQTAVPPSGYSFHTDVNITPELLSYVHGRVLGLLDGFAMEYHAKRLAAGEPGILKAPRRRKLVPRGTNNEMGLAAMRGVGWTEEKLVEHGYAEYAL